MNNEKQPVPGGGNDVEHRSRLVHDASRALRAGEVVVIPTDTVYGLSAAIDQQAAISRLYAVKGRPVEKAIPVLLSSPSRVHQVIACLPRAAAILASTFWPGALTLVLPALTHLPGRLTSIADNGLRTVAVRVPDHPLACAIIEASGGALAVTSANRSGEKPALDAREATALDGSPPILVIDGGRVSGGVPSTVVLATGEMPQILREGAISGATIFEALGNHSADTNGWASGRYDEPSAGVVRQTTESETLA